MLELSLRFPDPTHVIVSLNQDGEIEDAEPQAFIGPLDIKAQKDLHWHLEVYPAHYMTEIDDDRAAHIAARLPEWGTVLFERVFAAHDARQFFYRFQANAIAGRLLTVSAAHPAVLAQPWELLRYPKGTYLFLDDPRISIRRRLSGAGGGRRPFQVQAKDRLHLLFVVSRPSDTSFIDPRSDPKAVMDSLDERAPGRVTVEFVRPATLDALTKRLEDEDRPAVDILHFDGHGAFDAEGKLAEAAKQAIAGAGFGELLKEGAEAATSKLGFLLFEKEDGKSDPVSAILLGEMLNRKRIGLTVLSACQSAMVGGEDAMGSVAARLTHSGLPTVVAMTHSVLVATTRALFDELYDELARGRPIGTALDNARRALYANPGRGQRRRGEGFITLTLQDWFLPALYQAGGDTALLTKSATVATAAPSAATGLEPLQESGFWGRRRELWDIERWFVGGTRRLVVHGFGGEGKTYLASEAGRWLVRTGLFARVCFIDYKAFQGVDAVGYAISTLGTILGVSLIDAKAATAALAATPTLLILDNLEAVSAQAVVGLLDAARTWSEAGSSHVLVTTRQPDLGHPEWLTQGSIRCRYLSLRGLQPEDARDWFQELMKLPPEPTVPLPSRDALDELFGKVGFHPLSIGVLANVLKTRRIAEVGERLAEILKDEKDPLVASLNLSLERLDPALRALLPKLGVFQGGALEPMVTEVTGLNGKQWAALRGGLEHTGLVRAEALPGAAPYLRFHPTLAPALWSRLSDEERDDLTARHRAKYYDLSGFLHFQDSKAIGPTRAITRAELPNLMAAVFATLEVGAPHSAAFARLVDQCLYHFQMTRDREALARQVQAQAGERGTETWYLVRQQLGDQLSGVGRLEEAKVVYADILSALSDAPSLRRGVTLIRLAGCHRKQGRATESEKLIRQGLTEIEGLEQTREVRRMTAVLQTDLSKTLLQRGDLPGARAAIEAGLAIVKELGDQREVAQCMFELGRIAVSTGKLTEAEALYRSALRVVEAVGELGSVSAIWHSLGEVYLRQGEFLKAENAIRTAAHIRERGGDLDQAAASWSHLGNLMRVLGNAGEAEEWFNKELVVVRDRGDRRREAMCLNNLALTLLNVPGRLSDARGYGDLSLKLKQSLDPATSTIWTTYGNLADIAALQGNEDEARAFRRLERESFAAAPAVQMARRRHAPLIAAVAAATVDHSQRPAVVSLLPQIAERGGGKLAAALSRLFDGERDEDGLCDGLDYQDWLIVTTVLRAIADPTVLANLQPHPPPTPSS